MAQCRMCVLHVLGQHYLRTSWHVNRSSFSYTCPTTGLVPHIELRNLLPATRLHFHLMQSALICLQITHLVTISNALTSAPCARLLWCHIWIWRVHNSRTNVSIHPLDFRHNPVEIDTSLNYEYLGLPKFPLLQKDPATCMRSMENNSGSSEIKFYHNYNYVAIVYQPGGHPTFFWQPHTVKLPAATTTP